LIICKQLSSVCASQMFKKASIYNIAPLFVKKRKDPLLYKYILCSRETREE
jgi:hypothetical protein